MPAGRSCTSHQQPQLLRRPGQAQVRTVSCRLLIVRFLLHMLSKLMQVLMACLQQCTVNAPWQGLPAMQHTALLLVGCGPHAGGPADVASQQAKRMCDSVRHLLQVHKQTEQTENGRQTASCADPVCYSCLPVGLLVIIADLVAADPGGEPPHVRPTCR